MMRDQPIRLTFRNGGWVLVMTGVVLVGIFLWAIAPALLRLAHMPPGDNQTIESYEFDLSNLQIPRELVVPAMRHRNMSPVVREPIVLSPEEIQHRNVSKRDPLVVSKDLVVGIDINGETRAYPLHFLDVHEIINDTLGGIPVAIIWHWPSGHLAVFERTLDSAILQFANSGLAGNGGMLFYPLQDEIGNEQLFSSMLSASVSGNPAVLTPVPHDVVSWKRWFEEHPETTLLGPDEQLKKRYRKASPNLYFRTERIYFPTQPMPSDGIDPKTLVIVISNGGAERVFSLPELLDAVGDGGEALLKVGETDIVLRIDAHPLSATVRTSTGEAVISTRALWFAWFGNHPDATLASSAQE